MWFIGRTYPLGRAWGGAWARGTGHGDPSPWESSTADIMQQATASHARAAADEVADKLSLFYFIAAHCGTPKRPGVPRSSYLVECIKPGPDAEPIGDFRLWLVVASREAVRGGDTWHFHICFCWCWNWVIRGKPCKRAGAWLNLLI